MSRIKQAFTKKAFIGFVTGGDPTLEKCEEYIMDIIRGGADLIEIGIPFSDPIAEGTVIQEANQRALAAGATTEGIFNLVVSLRKKTEIPLVFLTYLNPVFHYGYEAFFERCAETGVDGIIIPDLPYEERQEIVPYAEKCQVDLITLIAPTSKERMQMLAKAGSGFLYMVSSMGVTGVRSEFAQELPERIESVKAVTDIPCAVGFGINTPEQAAEISGYADGVIVGSAIVKLIGEYKDQASSHLYEYVKQMKAAME